MCGICGYMLLPGRQQPAPPIIERMAEKLYHRGPDGTAFLHRYPVTFGFTRLSIIDLSGGMQPLTNEDNSLMLICNGEIFNYIELREELRQKGHTFKTHTDVEVILHLYEEFGVHFLNRLNGQFAFALYDEKRGQLFCARDYFGIIPFFYTMAGDGFVFGSEIKAILGYPGIKKELDLVALDQVFTFPGLISPRTMFKGIKSLENGHYLLLNRDGQLSDHEYWDLVYPEIGHTDYAYPERYYVEKLNELIDQSIRLRLRADVPVGCYLSGGLDSSLIASKLMHLTPDVRRYSFSIDFADHSASEADFQRTVASMIESVHSEKLFLESDVIAQLPRTIYHCECPVKESYNTASLTLSRLVRDKDIKVVLSGEGADELFGGYVGYKFDKIRGMMAQASPQPKNGEHALREVLWGNEDFFYEKDYHLFSDEKKQLYASSLSNHFHEIDCLQHFIIDKEKIRNREILHQRSYVDYKLRMVDHLVSDHGDRMAMANSVEARYPFLDKHIAEFAYQIPTGLKLKDFQEKHIIREIAKDIVPSRILKREKFGFIAPPSTQLLKKNHEYVNDLLSYDAIKRRGYFNPDTIEALKQRYSEKDFKLNIPFESDLLITVLTFGVFLEQFDL